MQDEALARFIPGNEGTVIVTTRDREVAGGLAEFENVIKKNDMGQNEARLLFKQHYPKAFDPGNNQASLLLLEAFQFLPLAIVQAASYLRINSHIYV